MPLPPPETPPAHYRLLEARVDRQAAELQEQRTQLQALRSKQGADALSVQHQLGWLAGWVLAIGRKLGVDASSVKPHKFPEVP